MVVPEEGQPARTAEGTELVPGLKVITSEGPGFVMHPAGTYPVGWFWVQLVNSDTPGAFNCEHLHDFT